MEKIYKIFKKRHEKKDYMGWLIWLGVFGFMSYLGKNYLVNKNFNLSIVILFFLAFFLVIIFSKYD